MASRKFEITWKTILLPALGLLAFFFIPVTTTSANIELLTSETKKT